MQFQPSALASRRSRLSLSNMSIDGFPPAEVDVHARGGEQGTDAAARVFVEVGPEDPLPWRNDRDVEASRLQGGGHLHGDQAGPDDDRPPPGLEPIQEHLTGWVAALESSCATLIHVRIRRDWQSQMGR